MASALASASASDNELNINSYLDSVEAAIRNQSPTITKKISEPNRKPMIRTLLGIKEKSEFDAALRTTRKEEEFSRLALFCKDILRPAIEKDGRRDEVPDLPDIISDALSQPRTSGAGSFRKLGTGRKYMGNATAMISDIAPQTLPYYAEATAELTDFEILATVIQSKRSDVDGKYIDAAMRCLDDFPCNDNSFVNINDDAKGQDEVSCPKLNGLQCEQSCTEYLQSRLADDEVFIPNVNVNHRSALLRSKYRNNNSIHRKNSSPCSGIIWTDVDRANACSEFDGLIYSSSNSSDGEAKAEIKEIWEAKFSVSPSTLWDAVTKKASAIREIMSDDSAQLSHDGKQMTIQSNIEGQKLVFGIYGSELLSPQNAIGQMVSMGCASMLSKDAESVMKALENGFVEVPREKCLYDIDILRKELQRVEQEFHISLHISR